MEKEIKYHEDKSEIAEGCELCKGKLQINFTFGSEGEAFSCSECGHIERFNGNKRMKKYF